MKTIKSITILEEAMDTLNQALQDAAHGGNVEAMEKLSRQMVEMAQTVGGLYNAMELADRLAPMPFMGNKPPVAEGER